MFLLCDIDIDIDYNAMIFSSGLTVKKKNYHCDYDYRHFERNICTGDIVIKMYFTQVHAVGQFLINNIEICPLPKPSLPFSVSIL